MVVAVMAVGAVEEHDHEPSKPSRDPAFFASRAGTRA
jgi:hypothetical protein